MSTFPIGYQRFTTDLTTPVYQGTTEKYLYATDAAAQLAVLANTDGNNGTYYFYYQLVPTNPANPMSNFVASDPTQATNSFGLPEYGNKLVTSSGYSTMYTFDYPSGTWQDATNIFGHNFNTSTIGFALPIFTSTLAVSVYNYAGFNFFADNFASSYRLKLTYIDENNVTTVSYSESFDIRALIVAVVQATPPIFNPLNPKGTTITGNYATLPAPNSPYPGQYASWQPTSSTIQSTLTLYDPTGYEPPLLYEDGSAIPATISVPVSAPDANGNIGSFSITWSGRDANGKPLQGHYAYFVVGSTGSNNNSVPGGGDTNNDEWFLGSEVTASRCSCLNGACNVQANVSPVTDPLSLDMDVLLAFSSQYIGDGTSSLGYGWKSTANVTVATTTSGDLVYFDETGDVQRWSSAGSAYTPFTTDNYILARFDSGTNTYKLIFQDQTQRVFDATSGHMIQEVDRNNNTLTYTYTGGNLMKVQDSSPSGRNITYGYGARADGQPMTITAQGTTSHTYTLSYFASNDPVSPNRLKSVQTPQGDLTQFVYTSQGFLQSVTDPTGKVASYYTYDGIGRKLTEQSYDQTLTSYAYGTNVFYEYEGGNNLIGDSTNAVSMQIQDLTGNSPTRLMSNLYDSNFNPIYTTELADIYSQMGDSNIGNDNYGYVFQGEVNHTTMYYLDAVSNNPYLVTQIIDPNSNNTYMTYNKNGNLATYTDAQNHITSYLYAEDLTGAQADTNPKHQNLLVQITRPSVTVNGSPVTYTPTKFGYDPNGNLTSIIDANSQTTAFSVNTDGTIASITDVNTHVTTFSYDSNTRNLLTVTIPLETGDAGVTPTASNPTGSQRVTTFGYDVFDNLTSVQDALGNTVHFLPDLDRRRVQVTDANGFVTAMTYLNGLMTQVALPANSASSSGSTYNNRNIYYSFDDANRVSKVARDFSATYSGPTAQTRVQYLYDGFSQLRQLVRQQTSGGGNNIYSYNYDPLGRMVAAIDPLARLTATTYAPYCMEHTVTTSRGIQRTQNYDSLCRLVQVASQREQRNYNYDELSRMVSDSNGGRFGATFSGAIEGAAFQQAVFLNGRTYLYDMLDRLMQMTFPDGTTVAYTYDYVGNVLTMKDVFNRVTTYTYYADNALASVSYQDSGGTSHTFNYTYDLAGRLAQMAFPSSTNLVLSFTKSDGTTGWDAGGRLVSMRYLKSGTSIQSFEYTYDHSNNRTQMVDASTAATITWNYGYDWLDRLVSASNGTTTNVYTYDNSDNRLSVSSNAGAWTYDVADQLLSHPAAGGTENLTYDRDGNTLSRTVGSNTTQYAWSDFNNLGAITQNGTVEERDFYQADGIRRLKSDGTKYYNDTGGNSLADLRPTSGKVSFIQGNQLLGLDEGGAVYFFLTDALSSVRQVVDSSGNVQASASTNEFGIPTSSSGSSDLLNHSYVGGLGVRNETGNTRELYLMQQRWMAPDLGRFLNQDPVGFTAGLNLYSYALSNPSNRVDFNGLSPVCPGYRINVYVDLPEDDPPFGHVILGISDPDNDGKMIYRGFSTQVTDLQLLGTFSVGKASPAVIDQSAPTGLPAQYSRIISADTARAIFAFINGTKGKIKKGQCGYQLFGGISQKGCYSCASFAIEILDMFNVIHSFKQRGFISPSQLLNPNGPDIPAQGGQ
jgi:RHS repeat-associated protein